METITSLLRRLVALLTALVMTMTGSDAIDGGVSLILVEYPVMPLALAQTSLVAYFGGSSISGPVSNSNGYIYFNYGAAMLKGSSQTYRIVAGYQNLYTSGTQVTVSCSSLTGYYHNPQKNTSGGYQYWQSSKISEANSLITSFDVYDSSFNVLATITSSSRTVTFTLTRDVSFIGIGFSRSFTSSGDLYYFGMSLGLSGFNIATVVPPTTEEQILDSVNAIRSGVANVANTNQGILSGVNDIADSMNNLAGIVGTPSAMEQFEQKYLESMEDQLDKVESMLSPDNPALPNNGDVAGFVSDIQDGLGLSGSSFNASEFAEATSAFGGTSATAAGGPWEFFTQAVADSLAGDTSSVGLADDDYIYAWLDQMQGRYSLWHSSSP